MAAQSSTPDQLYTDFEFEDDMIINPMGKNKKGSYVFYPAGVKPETPVVFQWGSAAEEDLLTVAFDPHKKWDDEKESVKGRKKIQLTLPDAFADWMDEIDTTFKQWLVQQDTKKFFKAKKAMTEMEINVMFKPTVTRDDRYKPRMGVSVDTTASAKYPCEFLKFHYGKDAHGNDTFVGSYTTPLTFLDIQKGDRVLVSGGPSSVYAMNGKPGVSWQLFRMVVFPGNARFKSAINLGPGMAPPEKREMEEEKKEEGRGVKRRRDGEEDERVKKRLKNEEYGENDDGATLNIDPTTLEPIETRGGDEASNEEEEEDEGDE